MSRREQDFERMLTAVRDNYQATVDKMEQLKAEGKVKTVTFRQLLGDKMLYQAMLSLYKSYGLLDDQL